MQDKTFRGRRTEPTVSSSDPRFVWNSGADVQATWRRFGWVAPSASRAQFYEEPAPKQAPRRTSRAAA